MKKTKLIILVATIALLLSSCSTFDGYYYSLEDARTKDQYAKYYDNENLIFSKSLDNGIIDFIIDDDSLHIMCIVKKSKADKELFQIKTAASFMLNEQIQDFKDNEQYKFHDSTRLAALQYSWCIVTKQYNENNDNLDSFEFEHNNQLYHLCIKAVNIPS